MDCALRFMRSLQVVGTSTVPKAHARLGSGPLKVLFEQVRGPLTTPQSPGAFAFGRCLLMLALDGTVLAVAPTLANIKAFGPPPGGGSHKPGCCPQVKLVLLIACGTRGILHARFGPRRDNEVALAKQLATAPTLSCGQLVLMDQAFHGHDYFAQAPPRAPTSLSARTPPLAAAPTRTPGRKLPALRCGPGLQPAPGRLALLQPAHATGRLARRGSASGGR